MLVTQFHARDDVRLGKSKRKRRKEKRGKVGRKRKERALLISAVVVVELVIVVVVGLLHYNVPGGKGANISRSACSFAVPVHAECDMHGDEHCKF